MAAYAALVSLIHIIDRIQLHPRPPIFLQQQHIELLISKAAFLQEFLEAYNSNFSYSSEADPLESRIADVAHAAEDLIESHIVDNITNHRQSLVSAGLDQALKKVIEDLDCIEKEAMEIKETMGVEPQLERISTTTTSLRSSSVTQMVGVDDVLLEVMDKLTGGQADLQTISIVGMGGIGKTALASNIFQKPLIKEYFHIYAWATISQQYNLREFSQEILCQLNIGYRPNRGEEELGVLLYQHLCGRRYMIILDDLWSIEAWDEVRRFFPDNRNGSRILVTTRLLNLASNLTSSNSFEMRLLDEANSWNLLSKIVFGDECSCPLELEETGKRVSRSCRGLPLSLVVIGGCLAKCKHAKDFWDYIEENLSSVVILEDNEVCLRTLHMSYKHLPIYLKPCFLYMGVFPEYKAIRVSKLVKLWVAEGFVKPISGEILEAAAKEYLKELVDRNLIMIHEVGSTGNMKYCRIHDVLRELCLREADKERFYHVVRPHTPPGIVNRQRRIVVSGSTSEKEAMEALQSGSVARSLIWDLHDVLPPLMFKLLRILSFLPPIRAAYNLESIFQLVNLRSLVLDGQWRTWRSRIPSAFCLLWNLQTLIFDGFQGMTAPTEIWDMPQIRHILFGMLRLPDPPSDRCGIVLGNLQTLVKIKDLICSEEVVWRIPNINKLRVSDESHHLSNLASLHKLESFGYYAFPKNELKSMETLKFPHSLKKLSLQIGYSQCWQDILGMVGALPALEKLKLYWGNFRGSLWETSEGHFRRLKFLEINDCEQFETWTMESSHFPCLERLVLQGLRRLSEIPLDLAEIATLGLIEVKFCGESATISAKRVVEEQEALYGEIGLQVRVMVLRRNEVLESLACPNFRVKYFE